MPLEKAAKSTSLIPTRTCGELAPIDYDFNIFSESAIVATKKIKEAVPRLGELSKIELG